MGKKKGHEERESKLASGWTIESEQSDDSLVSETAHAPGASAVAATGNEQLLDADGQLISEQDSEQRPQMSNGSLVVLGVIGGLYLLYTWVWFSWADFYAAQNTYFAEVSGSFGFFLQQITFWAAPAAPALWFLAAILLNKNAPTWRLALWLLIGAVVLVPLPMFGSFWGAAA